jgi:hypothetical protein
MEPVRSSAFDPWDLDRLRLPPSALGVRTARRRLPRHRAGEPFLRGPIPYAWISTACRLPGSGLHVATAVRFLRDRFPRNGRWSVEELAVGLHLSVRSVQRGLHSAEEAGLVSASREPGCKPSLRVLVLPEPPGGPERPPLFGPIPWAWWLRALRLGGASLQVATACWLAAGWENSPEIELALGGWSSLGLARDGSARGLDSLRSSGLVSVALRPGKSPLVLITDPPLP